MVLTKQEKKNKNFWIYTQHIIFGLVASIGILYGVFKMEFSMNYYGPDFFISSLTWMLRTVIILAIWIINSTGIEYRLYN